MSGPPPQVNINAALQAQQAADCFDLKAQGKTVRQIAEILGLGKSTVQRRIEQAVDDTVSPRVETYRAIQDQQIDQAMAVVLAIITDPDANADLRLKAIDRLGRLMERRARLHGLDAPVKVEGTVTHQTQQELELAALYADQFAAIDAQNEARRAVIEAGQ